MFESGIARNMVVTDYRLYLMTSLSELRQEIRRVFLTNVEDDQIHEHEFLDIGQ